MSMLNRRTQPLDPAVLASLTAPSQPAAPAARETAPLKEPEIQLNPDSLRPPGALRSDIPAQSASISGALASPAALPAPVGPSVASAADLATRLSESESELLLDVSARLADTRMQDPAAFAEIMSALQKLNTDASGQVDFSALSTRQQDLLKGLGMTPGNTKVIFKQLYHMLLPEAQTDTSQAFKRVQAHVTSFISNLDLRERTVNQIQEQARDLAAVQGVVSNLSAGSISALLADQTNSAFDLSVSKITSQNFEIKTGMDYTLGHMFMLSQQSPATLQQIENLIDRVGHKQAIDGEEKDLLKRFGLELLPDNNFRTLDGKVLGSDSVSQLNNVISSLKDPSEKFSKVLRDSAALIAQSNKIEEYARQAQQQALAVQQTTQQVVAGTQNLEQKRQETNAIDAQLKFAHVKAESLVGAMNAATGLFGGLPVEPQFLSQFNVKIVRAPGAGPESMKYFVNDKECTRMEMFQHLGALKAKQDAEIAGLTTDLARKQTEVLTSSANLGVTTQKLETQKQDLKATEQVLERERGVLREMEADYKKTLAEALPDLKPEEKAFVETQLVPVVEKHVASAEIEVVKAVELIHVTVAKAETAIVQAKAVQQAVNDDAKVWQQHIADSGEIGKRLDDQLLKLKQAVAEHEAPATPRESGDFGLPERQPALAAQPEPVAVPGASDEAELEAKLQRKATARAQQRLENSYLEQARSERAFGEGLRAQQQNRERAKKDADTLKAEIKELQE